MLLLAIVFFCSERKELQAIIPQIIAADPLWLFAGFALTIIYFYLYGGMYRKSFSAVSLLLPWSDAVILFLKRNFISVFLPAGGISSLAYSPSQIRKAGFNRSQVHQASALFGFIGLLSVFIAGLPIIIFTVFYKNQFNNTWIGLVILFLLLVVLLVAARSIKQKKGIYNWISKKFPQLYVS